MNTQLKASPYYSQLKLSFRLFNYIALSGWIILIALPFWSFGPTFVVYVVVVLLSLIYAHLLSLSFKERLAPGSDKPSFFSLPGVIAIFQKPTAILAAWVHILAFDLMLGIYIQQEGSKLDLGHAWLIPCYLLTLMFGPLGFLLFLLVSWIAV